MIYSLAAMVLPKTKRSLEEQILIHEMVRKATDTYYSESERLSVARRKIKAPNSITF